MAKTLDELRREARMRQGSNIPLEDLLGAIGSSMIQRPKPPVYAPSQANPLQGATSPSVPLSDPDPYATPSVNPPASAMSPDNADASGVMPYDQQNILHQLITLAGRRKNDEASATQSIGRSMANTPVDPADVARRARFEAMQRNYGGSWVPASANATNPELMARVDAALSGSMNPLADPAQVRSGILGSSPSNPLTSVDGLTNGAKGWVTDGNRTSLVQAPLEVSGGKAAARQRVLSATVSKKDPTLLNVPGATRPGKGNDNYAVATSLNPDGSIAQQGIWNEDYKKQLIAQNKIKRGEMATRMANRATAAATKLEKKQNPLSGMAMGGGDNPLANIAGLVNMGVPVNTATTVVQGAMDRADAQRKTRQDAVTTFAGATPEQREMLHANDPQTYGEMYRKWKGDSVSLSDVPQKYRSYISNPDGSVNGDALTKILKDPNVPQEDKDKLRPLMPYSPPGWFGGGSEPRKNTGPKPYDDFSAPPMM